ncbi:hypothetical protein [Egbenema bharatensis]|uniref:hypothetical protein n=1 Tax=Egbenema bharatensis TaxID=3463334 RepID=UPI003A8BB4C8
MKHKTLVTHRYATSGYTPVPLSQWIAEARRREVESQMMAIVKSESHQPTESSSTQSAALL